MARPRGNKWQADVVIDGVRKRTSFDTKEEAEAYEAMISDGVVPTSTRQIGPFVDEQFKAIWKDNRDVVGIKKNLKGIYRYIPRTTPLPSITDAKVEELVSRLEAQGNSGGTINRKLAVLSKTLKRARKLRVIHHLPTIERQREGQGRQRTLTKAEELKAIEYLHHIGLPITAALVSSYSTPAVALGRRMNWKVREFMKAP